MTIKLPVQKPAGVTVRGVALPGTAEILSAPALEFVVDLARHFEPERQRLLERRRVLQAELDAGRLPDFLPETRKVREAKWRVASAPDDLVDRRVEITGPVERKMVINALNSGASVFMADFEDANSPTWKNNIEGQVNLCDAVRRRITFEQPETRKRYALNERTATLVVRPRGWHLSEAHVLVDGQPISASLFDFGLYFFHNARELVTRGSGPYFYLPKLENHLEARLWNAVFVHAQNSIGLPRGTIRATVLIETILAAFEMDEILFELREHCSGLNCGRWDYIFSCIKKFHARPDWVLPDRALVGMTEHFLRSYSQLLIQTCHRRGAHAMGGMAAQIPIKDDPAANAAALAKVEADKRREAGDGHDGTWVAHPALVGVARAVFDELMPEPNQLTRLSEGVHVGQADLLRVPRGPITAAGLCHNVAVGLRYVAAWLAGSGCVPLYHLMEDAATAEISRAQLWQWLHHAARLDDGRTVDAELFRSVLGEELARIASEPGATAQARERALAGEIFERMVTQERFEEFLTLPAYEHILSIQNDR